MLPSNPPLYPSNCLAVIAKTTAAKTTDTDTANAVAAYTVPNDGSVKFARVIKCTVKPLGNVATATRQKAYVAKSAAPTVLGILRDRVQAVVSGFSENAAQPEMDFNYGDTDFVYLAPGDIFYVGSGVALAAGFQWFIEIELY